jgi:hypothetical protein
MSAQSNCAMNDAEPSTHEAMVAEFLRGEWASSLYSTNLQKAAHFCGCPRDFILNPDIGNEKQNRVRECTLMSYRGPLFRGFPFGTTRRFRANLSFEELRLVRLVAAGVWPVLSDGSGNLAEVVRRISAGELTFPAESEEAKTIEIIQNIAEHLDATDIRSWTRRILVAAALESIRLIALEGYKRLSRVSACPNCRRNGTAHHGRRIRAFVELGVLSALGRA